MNGGKRINAGRKVGIPNEVTTEIKETVLQFLLKNIGKLQKSFDTLDPKEQIYFIEKLLKYYLPTQLATNVDFSEKQVVIFKRKDATPPDWWLRKYPKGTQEEWLNEVANGKQMMPPVINVRPSVSIKKS